MKGRFAALAAALAVVLTVFAVAAQAATGSPSSSTNLSPNPVLASSLAGYSIQEGGTGLTRVAVSDHVAASWAARVTQSNATTRVREPRVAVTAGTAYTFASDVKAPTGATVQITVSWFSSAGAFLSWTGGAATTGVSPTNWQRYSASLVAPAAAAVAETVVNVWNGKKSAYVYVTQHDVEPPAVAPTPTPTPTPDPTPTPTPDPQPSALTNRPAQAASVFYGDPADLSLAAQYAHPGGLVVAGRTNYGDQAFRDVSAAGGTVLIYLDALIDNDWGRYHDMLMNASPCGAAVPLWPGNYQANSWGYLNDFRVGGVLQNKLECVLEAMVAENPHMAGWFADDLGSRSWYADINWSTFPDKQAYRDGAIALSQTFRRVADRHGLIFMVNGTWSANDGGGYPDVAQHGNALADGGFVEHHDGQLGFFGPYACSSQWAAQSSITRGTAFMYAVTNTDAARDEFANSGCYAYVGTQPTSAYGGVPAWGTFHPTGLPSRVTS